MFIENAEKQLKDNINELLEDANKNIVTLPDDTTPIATEFERISTRIAELNDQINDSILTGNIPGAAIAVAELKTLEDQMSSLTRTAERLRENQATPISDLPQMPVNVVPQLKIAPVRLQEISQRTFDIKLALNANPQDADTVRALRAELKDLGDEAALIAPKLPASFSAGVEETIPHLERLSEQIRDNIRTAMTDLLAGVAGGIGDLLSGMGDGTQLMQAAFLPILNVMEQLGKIAISAGVAIEGIKKALTSLKGPIAIGAGIALIAVSRFIKGKITNLGKGMFRGGLVEGEGTETSDSVPVRLSRNEYVLRASAVRSIGVNTLDKINTAPARMREHLLSLVDIPTRALGGMLSTVGSRPSPDFSGSAANPSSFDTAHTFHHTGEFKLSGRDLILALEAAAPAHYARTGRKIFS
jgi:chaperonin cofactor prefoldin